MTFRIPDFRRFSQAAFTLALIAEALGLALAASALLL